MKSLERSKSMRRKRKEDVRRYEKLLNRICTAFKLEWISEKKPIPDIVIISLVPMHSSDLLDGSCRLERQNEDGILEFTSFFFGSTLEEASKEVLNAFVRNNVLRCLSIDSSKKNRSLVIRTEDIHTLDSLDMIEMKLDLLGV